MRSRSELKHELLHSCIGKLAQTCRCNGANSPQLLARPVSMQTTRKSRHVWETAVGSYMIPIASICTYTSLKFPLLFPQPFPLVSSSRWMVKRGELTAFVEDSGIFLRRTSRQQVYFLLFNDVFIVTRKKRWVEGRLRWTLQDSAAFDWWESAMNLLINITCSDMSGKRVCVCVRACVWERTTPWDEMVMLYLAIWKFSTPELMGPVVRTVRPASMKDCVFCSVAWAAHMQIPI